MIPRFLKSPCTTFAAVFFMSLMALSPEMASAQGNSGNTPGAAAPGKNKNLGHNNASDGVMAIIQANRHIFYSGDPLEIGVRFPRGADLVTSGEVDAHLLIFKPDAETTVLPISDEASENQRNLFEIGAVDVETLPEGVYQLGVVITVPDGDPLNMDDWFNGLLGLLTVQGLTVSEDSLEVDMDGDGFVDDDADGDGFEDDEVEEEEEEEENDTTE